MSAPVVDLRSDTVTRPGAGMRAAMAEAEVGDDVYGEDPTVNALEAEVAALLGFPAGLFVPSGTLGNQLGIQSLVRPGEELVCDTLAHIARAEAGIAAVFSGITFRTWRADRGRLDPDAIAELIHRRPARTWCRQPQSPWRTPTTSVAGRFSHRGGGRRRRTCP